MSAPELFPYQQEGAELLASRWSAYLADDPGLGKTAQVITATDAAGAQRILVLCPASLKVNWAREFEKFSQQDRPICMPTAKDTVPQDGPLVCVVNYDIVIRKALHEQLLSSRWDVLACDECFPAGTKVATPSGAVPIEALQEGDEVLNACGVGRVTGTSQKTVDALVEVTLSSGDSARCTDNHPWLTTRGWLRAGDLLTGDEVVAYGEALRILRHENAGTDRPREEEAFLRSVLLSEMEDVATAIQNRLDSCTSRTSAQENETADCRQTGYSSSILTAHAGTQSHAFRGCTAEGVTNLAQHRAQAVGTWGKRNRSHYCRSNTAENPPRVGGAGRGIPEIDARSSAADLLQGRCGFEKGAPSYRSGWQQPSVSGQERAGSEKSTRVTVRRVERVTCNKRAGSRKSAGSTVFNISVSGHPSYIVAGCVVHNCHALKNPTSKRTRAVLGQYGLYQAAYHTWLMSGTPAPNHPGELYPALSALHPVALYGMSYDKWLRHYCYVREGTHGPVVIGNRPTIKQLKEDLDGFLIRRKREEVLTDLPPLRTGRLAVCNDAALAAVRASLPEELRYLEAMLDEDAWDAMADEMDEMELATMRRLAGEAKAHALVEEVAEELNGGVEKMVLMCWHRRTMDILEQGLQQYGVARIDGSTKNRQVEVDKFQDSSSITPCRIFVGQIQAAGAGHTLTAASDMLIVEPSWTPGENVQAMLRIHRIGQQRGCLVRFVALAGSIDEIIMAVAERKAKMLAEILE